MKSHDRQLRDGRRVRRLCAALRSNAVIRTAMLVGLFAVAWLAGVAAAQADPVADGASDAATRSHLSAVDEPIVDSVAAESEQAALIPANQLESVTSSILDVPAGLLGSVSPVDASEATPSADTSADVPATRTIDSATADHTTDASASGGLQAVVDPMIAPLAAVAEPITGNLTTVTTGVGRALDVSRPLAVATHPVDSLLSRLAPVAAARSATVTPLLASLTGGTGFDPGRDAAYDFGNGVLSARAHDEAAGVFAEPTRNAAGETVSEGDVHWVHGDRHSDPTQSSIPVRTDFGPTTSGVVPVGSGSGGPTSVDGGTGHLSPVHADRNAVVSRVTPVTAVFGQLPDHVKDPAVSPD